MKPDILYEDNDLIVCIKPAGIPTQSSRIGTPDLVSILKNHLHTSSVGKPRQPYLAVIHRLDQPVEGILVFAKIKSRCLPEPPASIRRIRQTLSGMALRFLTERRGRSDRPSGKKRAFQHLHCLRKRHAGCKRSTASL